MARKLTVDGLVKRINKHKNAIAQERDKLREIYDDLESILESTDEGVDELDHALDVLSQYV